MSDGYRWIFIGDIPIPILCEKKKMSKQFLIEMWLDPKPLHEAVGVKKLEENIEEKTRYVV